MQIDKQQIISALTKLGDHGKATQADSDLPDTVDTEKDSSLLDKLGINVGDLLGGGGLGNIAGKIGL